MDEEFSDADVAELDGLETPLEGDIGEAFEAEEGDDFEPGAGTEPTEDKEEEDFGEE